MELMVGLLVYHFLNFHYYYTSKPQILFAILSVF